MTDENEMSKELYLKIINHGFVNVLSNGYGMTTQDRDYIIRNLEEFPEVMCLLKVDSVCSGIVNRSYELDIKLDPNGLLKEYFERCESVLSSNDMQNLMGWNSRSSEYLRAASMLEEFDWTSLFDKAFSWVRSRRYYGDAFTVISTEAAKRNSEHFLNVISEPLFKTQQIPYGIRAQLYSVIVRTGLLDTKMARKMRSDPSEFASNAAVTALLDTTDAIYSNRDQLLIVFSDSKYQDVIKTLAHGLPKHLLSSILGTDFHWLKSIIDSRMQNDEK